MPTYSYQCKECGEAFDAQQSFSDDPLTVCPNCGGPLRKLFNSVGVVFKGSGFYITDYGKDGKGAKKPPAESSSAADSKPAAAPKTESK